VSSKGTKKATIIIPALNEERGIELTLKEILQVVSVADIIVVDGGSLDGTAEIAEKLGAHVLIEKNTGYGSALYHGIKQLNSNVRYVVFTDADFTYPAKYVSEMIEILEKNPDVGMVVGNRFYLDDNVALSLGNKLLALAQHLLSGFKLEDPLSGFRALRAEILNNWVPKSSSFDIEAEINAYVARKGYQIVEIPIYYRHRIGEKKLKLRHGFRILRRILVESFRTKGSNHE
jgi:glycosyltransferase involved in cell wall biosynthesis